jgi:hypothetical protein
MSLDLAATLFGGVVALLPIFAHGAWRFPRLRNVQPPDQLVPDQL